jgi:hypothetical protein
MKISTTMKPVAHSKHLRTQALLPRLFHRLYSFGNNGGPIGVLGCTGEGRNNATFTVKDQQRVSAG